MRGVRLRFFVSACNLSNQEASRTAQEQDVAEAKRLIEQHMPGGFDLDVVVRALGPLYTDPAQLLIQQLRRIGIRGTLRTMESAAGFAAYARGDFHFIGG